MNIGNSRMIANEKEREVVFFSLLHFIPMFTKSCEHCVNISQERVAEAPTGEWSCSDDFRLHQRLDDAAKGVRVDVQVSEQLSVVECATAVVQFTNFSPGGTEI